MTLRFFNIIACLFFPFWMYFQNGTEVSTSKPKIIRHKIELHHPSFEGDYMERLVLKEFRDENGLATNFSMKVSSVICFEEVCKVVPVWIRWNNLGEFVSYLMVKGAKLEKYEADFFNKDDYLKLQRILANRNSPFKDVKPDEILTVVEPNLDGVDAVSGATALALDEKDTVHGAALTCYTLWHWVNGDVISIIRQKSAEAWGIKDFVTFLNDRNVKHKLLAIEQLTLKNNFNDVLVEAVTFQASKNDEILKPAIKYFEAAPIDIYFKSMEALIENGGENQRLLALASLLNTNGIPSIDYLNRLSEYLSKSKSFQEVTFFLRLMEDKNPNSKAVVKNAIPLLEKDIIVARRIYWFLINQELDAEQQISVDKFHKKHQDQL